MFRKYTLVVGVFAIVMLLLSTTTAVPHIKGTIVSKKIKQAENTKLILANKVFDKNNLDKILSKIRDTIDLEKLSKQAEKIKKILEQKYGKEFVNRLDTAIDKILATLDIPPWLESLIYIIFGVIAGIEYAIIGPLLLSIPVIGPILVFIAFCLIIGSNLLIANIVIEILDRIWPSQQPSL